MLSDLNIQKKVIGLKESKKAIKDGLAQVCYIGYDADDHVVSAMTQICAWGNVKVDKTYTKGELGSACNIDVSAAVVTLIKEQA